jgi:hypothetical protein
VSRLACATACTAVFAAQAGAGVAASYGEASLTVVNSAFRLQTDDARAMTSRDLVGASFEIVDHGRPSRLRIDAVAPAAERRDVLLHILSRLDARTGTAQPYCAPDAQGRRAAIAVAGRWDRGRFVKDAGAWFLACTSGARGKCLLWGYDPWRKGPHGEDLAPYYAACIRMVRADYAGRGATHTRDGTLIEVWDAAGIRHLAGLRPLGSGSKPAGPRPAPSALLRPGSPPCSRADSFYPRLRGCLAAATRLRPPGAARSCSTGRADAVSVLWARWLGEGDLHQPSVGRRCPQGPESTRLGPSDRPLSAPERIRALNDWMTPEADIGSRSQSGHRRMVAFRRKPNREQRDGVRYLTG